MQRLQEIFNRSRCPTAFIASLTVGSGYLPEKSSACDKIRYFEHFLYLSSIWGAVRLGQYIAASTLERRAKLAPIDSWVCSLWDSAGPGSSKTEGHDSGQLTSRGLLKQAFIQHRHFFELTMQGHRPSSVPLCRQTLPNGAETVPKHLHAGT